MYVRMYLVIVVTACCSVHTYVHSFYVYVTRTTKTVHICKSNCMALNAHVRNSLCGQAIGIQIWHNIKHT